MIIDTHSHWIPPAYAQALEDEGKLDPGVEATRQVVLGAQGAELLVNLDARFIEMDEAGVEVAALEIPPPGVGFADAGRAAAAARPASAKPTPGGGISRAATSTPASSISIKRASRFTSNSAPCAPRTTCRVASTPGSSLPSSSSACA